MLQGLYLIVVLLLSLLMPADASMITSQDETPQTLEQAIGDLEKYYLEYFKQIIGYLIKSEQFNAVPDEARDAWLGTVLMQVAKTTQEESQGIVTNHAVLINLAHELPDPQIVVMLQIEGKDEPTVMRFNTNYVRKVPIQKPDGKSRPLETNGPKTIQI